MANPSLSVIIPVKDLSDVEMATLNKLALSAPSLDVIAVGKISGGVPTCASNLRLIDRDCPIYEAMNLGARAAQTDYLLFMGIDDSLIPSSVDPVIAALRSIEVAPLVILPFKVGKRLVRQSPAVGRLRSFHHQGVLFHRQFLLDLGGYGTKYELHSDLDLMFRMQRVGTAKSLPWPLVVFAKGGMSTSGRRAVDSIREFFEIYRDHRVSRLAFGFAFSVALLVWYRIRFVVRSTFLPNNRQVRQG